MRRAVWTEGRGRPGRLRVKPQGGDADADAPAVKCRVGSEPEKGHEEQSLAWSQLVPEDRSRCRIAEVQGHTTLGIRFFLQAEVFNIRYNVPNCTVH